MSSRRENEGERLGRLAGTGKGSGGGLPLPDLFSAILNELLDNGAASIERLAEISASALEYKSNNVMTTWGSWEELAKDALKQLASREIAGQDDDGLWELGEKFTAGLPLVVIPAGKGRKADSVTIWPKDERERLSKADHAEREAASMVGRVRPVDSAQASAIRESISEVGQLYPVLKDQHGRVLDGGHRLEADPNWEPKVIKVRDDKHALAISLWANGGKELSSKTQNRINQLIGDLAGTNEIRRDRIAAELRRDASRSNRQIAELVGASHPTVAEVRQDLENFSKLEERIHRYEFTTAKTGKHSAACWCGEGEAQPRETADGKQPSPERQYVAELLTGNPHRSDSQILDLAGLSRNQHRIVESERKRLEDAGIIPRITARQGSDGVVRNLPGGTSAPRLEAEATPEPASHPAETPVVSSEPEPSLRKLMESPPAPGHDPRLTPEEAAAVAALKRVAADWPSSLALVSISGELYVVRIRDWEKAMPEELRDISVADIDGITTYGGEW